MAHVGKSKAKNRYKGNISHTATYVACQLQLGIFLNSTHFFNPQLQNCLDHVCGYDEIWPNLGPAAFVTVFLSLVLYTWKLKKVRNNIFWHWFLLLSRYNSIPMKSLGRFPLNPREVMAVTILKTFLRAVLWICVVGTHFSQDCWTVLELRFTGEVPTGIREIKISLLFLSST